MNKSNFTGYADYDIAFDEMIIKEISSDGMFATGKNGVDFVVAPMDEKVEFIAIKGKLIAYVKSEIGFPCYYPLLPVRRPKKIKAVMMDLDGTTVKSEPFWISIIEKTTGMLTNNHNFKLEKEDMPFVSGHSVSEHLQYCLDKYCPNKSIVEARECYFDITHSEMDKIIKGLSSESAFEPNYGVNEFLDFLKEKDIKIGLVTSGLYEKAYPEILSAFKAMGYVERPEDYYDSFISAGYRLRKGSVGTLGELEPKPHPWLYAETFNIGLGIPFSERNTVIGIEDSSAGVYSVRLSNVFTIGIDGGNIEQSGSKAVCNMFSTNFNEIMQLICEINEY